MKKKSLLIILFSLIIIIGGLLVSKAAYSFLGPKIDQDLIQKGVIVNTEGTLIFVPGDDLNLNPSIDNFNSTTKNLVSSTKPKVIFLKNEKEPDKTSENYYVGFRINNNSYKYTTDNETPEVILSIMDENNNYINSINNLEYIEEYNGFDITNKKDLYDINLSKEISLQNNKTSAIHNWTFTLTFVNLKTDQSLNETAELDIDLLFLDEKPTV